MSRPVGNDLRGGDVAILDEPAALTPMHTPVERLRSG
jgi:hypothetical protein